MNTQDKSGCSALFVVAVVAVICVVGLNRGCNSDKPSSRGVTDNSPGSVNVVTSFPEESEKRLKLQLCAYLELLLDFKDEEDFKAYGFGRGGPYHQWLSDVQNLNNSLPRGHVNTTTKDILVAPEELMQLGFEYTQKRYETSYVKQVLPELKRKIDYNAYLMAK